MLTVQERDGGHTRGTKAKRGQVRGLSSPSRYRLIKFLAKLNRPDAPVFLTLTYRDFVEDFQAWKEHLHAFKCALRYHYPSLAGVWRLEFQERGAPHFHILLWLGDCADLENLHALCVNLWLRIINQDTPSNRAHGVQLELVNDYRKTAFYISLYQAKDNQDRTDICTGREWGAWNRQALNLSPVAEYTLSSTGARLLRRVLRRAYHSHCNRVGRTVGNYSRALGREQNFTNFLPYFQARRLLEWVAQQAAESEPF